MNNKTGARRCGLLAGLVCAALCSGALAAEQCRGPNGQSMKCPTMTPMHCRDITTKKPAQCFTPNSERVPEPKPQQKPAPAPSAK